ncbi:MAG TPA: hypothetical protein VG146_06320 [Verrucomicrobiae bacterium]|nr:hypothetical protein [Verrucomicrobiae bacterium]
MQHTLIFAPPGSTNLNPNPTFNVVILYEDFNTGKKAKRTYDFLAENLDAPCQCANQMWKFDVLRIPKLCDMALRDAAEADVVILSCRGGDLPGHLKDWLQSWVAEAGAGQALVALFEQGSEEARQTRPLREYLAELAKKGGIEFFSQPGDWQARILQGDSMPPTHPSSPGENHFDTLARVVHGKAGVPRWEIPQKE